MPEPPVNQSIIQLPPHRRRHRAGGVLVAAAVVPGDAEVDGLTDEAVPSLTFGTGAAHLHAALRTPGSFSTAAVPQAAYVHH